MDLSQLFKDDKQQFESHLNEDMGNLKAINPEFRKIFNTDWGKGKARITNKQVGQNSPVITVDVVTARQAADMFFGNEEQKSNYQGMVLRINGEQVLGLGRTVKERYGKEEQYKAVLNASLYKQVENDEKGNKARFDKISKMFVMLHSDMEETTLALTQAKTLLNNIFKAFKEAGGKIDALIIGGDTNRAELKKARATAQSGVVPSSGATIHSAKFKSDTVRALNSRLEKFKASKAEKYGSPEEFMAAAIQKGFMDKINIDGFVYTLRDDQLRLSDITKPSSWHKSNAIKYQIDSSHSAPLKALSDELWSLRERGKEDPQIQSKVDELKAKFPPREVSIIMGMNGGMIVPQHVEVSQEKANYY
jgi:hypothetical protein